MYQKNTFERKSLKVVSNKATVTNKLHGTLDNRIWPEETCVEKYEKREKKMMCASYTPVIPLPTSYS